MLPAIEKGRPRPLGTVKGRPLGAAQTNAPAAHIGLPVATRPKAPSSNCFYESRPETDANLEGDSEGIEYTQAPPEATYLVCNVCQPGGSCAYSTHYPQPTGYHPEYESEELAEGDLAEPSSSGSSSYGPTSTMHGSSTQLLSTSGTQSSPTALDANASHPKNASSVLAFGIMIAVLVGIALFSGLGAWLWSRSRRRRRYMAAQSPDQTNDMAAGFNRPATYSSMSQRASSAP